MTFKINTLFSMFTATVYKSIGVFGASDEPAPYYRSIIEIRARKAYSN